MKNRCLSFGLVMLLSVASAFAQGGTTGPLTWNISDGTLTISGNGAMPDYNVYDVNESAPWWDYERTVNAVVIEDGVTTIGVYAFHWCSTIASITIPHSVTSIGDRAFDHCQSLTTITIPNSVTYIGGGAFAFCSRLTSIVIPDSVTRIEVLAFYFCTSLTSITIPNSVTSIGDLAFYFCTSLTSITIPNSVIDMGDATFSACTNLTSVTISEGLTWIGYEVFAYCTRLTSVVIPESVTWIGEWAFAYCFDLVSVTNHNPVPYYLSAAVFYAVIKHKCTIKVPTNSVSDYKNAEEWKKFNIVGIEETGIVEADNQLSLQVYPNPTSGEIQVTSCELQVTSVEVFDVFGRRMDIGLPSFGGIRGCDISHLPAGIYFIRIQTEKGAVTKKVVKNSY